MSLMGVVIVTYNSSDQIIPCLESLLASERAAYLRIVVVDNASPDDTVRRMETWSDGRVAFQEPAGRLSAPITLLTQTRNLGFAGGVNVALKTLLRDPEIDRFWLLNPDSKVPPKTPERLMAAPNDFALMGNRIIYADDRNRIQLDAGSINTRTGVTQNIHLGLPADQTPPPQIEKADFISGASLVASRRFVEAKGLMPEDYFLYYEEVDWALRRGDEPLRFCVGAEVYHIAGASIGSPSFDRGPSPLSLYHKHRSRMIFLRRWYPRSVATGLLFGYAKAAQLTIRHGWRAGWAVLAGQFGWRMPTNLPSTSAAPRRADSRLS